MANAELHFPLGIAFGSEERSSLAAAGPPQVADFASGDLKQDSTSQELASVPESSTPYTAEP